MKHFVKSLLIVACCIATTLPAWSQASTEGKEFWVALNMTTGTGGTDHEPFIYITTQHQGGSYTITNPADQSFKPITGLIPPTGYIKIKASINPASGDIDLNKWYPVGQTAQAVSNQIKNTGLKITTTVDCSVFAGNRLPQSFDAANILPVTALQTDYITQDYPGYDHENKGGGYPVTTILATENNTQVTILPTSAVLNSNGTAAIIKTLDAGQVLYLTGDNRASLSGSTITSDKKIAVFTGVNNTDVPGPVSARDHLYEQNMPVVYWGTHFVVTRSMKKDANRIRVTASNNGTEVIVDGISLTTINAGETYEFELCEATMRNEEGYTKALAEGRGTDVYIDGEAHYLETSCPCAVFSYDVSENYYIKKNGTSERDDNSAGDPAMVWISPLEQQLRKITFGVMNTDKTPTHYVNIITPTKGATSLAVREIAMNAGQVVYGNNLVQPTDIKTVPSNPAYSYARIKLTDNAEKVYTITSNVGFIAHVYGSGTKESYAYSCGSAAVQQGVNVNGETFTNGYISDSRFCIGSEMLFDAKVGTDEITRVDWNFGDGITSYNSTPTINHPYTVPGWYDVEADLYGHQVCTNENNSFLGKVKFSFRIVRPDTVRHQRYECVAEDYSGDMGRTDTTTFDCDSVVITGYEYGRENSYSYDLTVQDGCTLNGQWYEMSQEVTWVAPRKNAQHCDSTVTCNLRVLHCLDLDIPNRPEQQHICPGEAYDLPYTYYKGDIGEAHFICGQIDKIVTLSNNSVVLPTQDLKPGVYKARITVQDTICDRTLEFPIDLSVYYPSDIFKYKFNNVLAVYNQQNNGGYNFTAYQWYRNGLPIEGATSSVYHVDSTFTLGDIYFVMLTRADGLTLPSCPQTISNVPDYDEHTSSAPARKEIINQRMYIYIDDRVYDSHGQRIK